jgi:integrase
LVSVKKKYLWRHPSGRVYFRKTGLPLIRIHAQEGTAEFDREYWDIMSGKRWAAKTSFAALIEDYRKSDRWNGLKPRTRRDYEKVLEYLLEKIGDRDVRAFTRPDAINAQRANAERVRFANYIVQILVVLMEHAIDIGWIRENPARGVRALKTPDSKKRAHIPWPDWAVDLFREKASEKARLIFEIGVGTVQRPGDWVGFKWGDYDGANLSLSQGKTDKALVLPCTRQLKAALDAERTRMGVTPIAGRPIIARRDGGRMSYRTMSQIMLRERKRLGLEAYDLHAMRYRGVMELAWSGCTDDEIASYSGHATKQMIEKYAGEARQIMRARQAAQKRK